MRLPILLALTCAVMSQPLLAHAAPVCSVDMAAVQQAIKKLEPDYGDVLSDISCDDPTIPAQVIMCDAAYEADSGLWDMGRLDTLAWVYAYENATGRETSHEAPSWDTAFIETRDACTDTACLCAALIGHTNDSLGGLSPYSAR